MYLGFYPGLLAVAVVTDDGDVDRSISMDCRHPLKMRLFDFEADILDLLEATEEGMPAGVRIVGAGGLAGLGGGSQVLTEVSSYSGRIPIAHGDGELVQLVGQGLGPVLNLLDLFPVQFHRPLIGQRAAAKGDSQRKCRHERRDRCTQRARYHNPITRASARGFTNTGFLYDRTGSL